MRIKLSDIHVYYINSSKQWVRDYHMKEILGRYWQPDKITRVEAVMDDVKYNGVSMAHMVCIYKGLSKRKPFIVLEDDVDIWEWIGEIEIPDDVPVLYLGCSAYGESKITNSFRDMPNITILERDAMIKIIDDIYYRVLNMFGGHATMYLSMDYARDVLGVIHCALLRNRPHDVLLPELQTRYRVYGLRQSVFYQNQQYGGQERFTKIKL